MPNHITCILYGPDKILDSLSGENTAIDFDKIIPMPNIILKDSVASHIEDWARIATGDIKISSLLKKPLQSPHDAFVSGDYSSAADSLHKVNISRLLLQGPFPKDFSDIEFDQLIKMMTALRTLGYCSWYEWNAYETERRTYNSVKFQTAWSAPLLVLSVLSKQYPEETFRLQWADEDLGSNTGDITVCNGEITKGGKLENQSREAYDMALDLIYSGKLPKDMYRDEETGQISYKEEEEESDNE